MREEVYDPLFGDCRMCECGHTYVCHFNLETGEGWGCLFEYNCDCKGFKEKKGMKETLLTIHLALFHIHRIFDFILRSNDEMQYIEQCRDSLQTLTRLMNDLGEKILEEGKR